MYDFTALASVITAITAIGFVGRALIECRRSLTESERLADQSAELRMRLERLRDAWRPLCRASITSESVECPAPQPFDNYEPGSWK